MTDQMFTTLDREHPDEGFIRAHFGLRTLGQQAPYCSLTATQVKRRDSKPQNPLACGTMHTDLRQVFPELATFVKWHLCTDGIPMHYIANALYWHAIANGTSDWEARPGQDPRTVFVKHCVPLNSDDRRRLERALDQRWPVACQALEGRVPALHNTFQLEVVDALPGLVQALEATSGDR